MRPFHSADATKERNPARVAQSQMATDSRAATKRAATATGQPTGLTAGDLNRSLRELRRNLQRAGFARAA